MATIASQIERISNSRNSLRSKGKSLGLKVPAGTYWDDDTNTYKTFEESALTESDQIDKIAAAFNTINLYRNQNGENEIRVPINVRTDGENIVVESTYLDPGYYHNTLVVPYVLVQEDEDIVINVEMVSNYELSTKSETIYPSAGFNYMGQFGYTIKDGAISNENAGFNSTGVIVEVETSGWLEAGTTKQVNVYKSKIKSKVGTNAETDISPGSSIIPDQVEDTTLTIERGIFGNNRTLVVKSVASQTAGNAAEPDILDGKIAWVNGAEVTGEMPNHGGTSDEEEYTAAVASPTNYGERLAIKPVLGYYNDYSTIYTDIVYNPTRTFNRTIPDLIGGTDTMRFQTYYETIPAGYYPTAIKRKVTVQTYTNGGVTIDYTDHTATFKVAGGGWISPANISTANINAGPVRYVQTEDDLEATSHSFVIAPVKDENGNPTGYLTQVTVDNTVIFDLLSAI